MSITLSSADLEKLARAVQLLASPLDHDSIDDWRAAVNRHLSELLHADSAGFLLPVSDGLLMYSEEHDPAELARYPDYPPPPLIDGTPLWEHMIKEGVMTLASGYGQNYDLYLNSTYYQEYAGANGAHDTLAAAVALGGTDARGMACLHFWHARPQGRLFGGRETAILRLLFPAFQAGVESYSHWGRQRENLLQMLDGLRQPALICDLSGRVLHMTPSVETILEADPEAILVRAELLATVGELCRSVSGRSRNGGARPGRFVRRVRTRTARYRLCGCLYGGPPAGELPFAVIGLKRLTPVPPSADALRERFGLTQRQVEVALLLARRKSNEEVAAMLSISRHTARRHTEAVMTKLGVRDRRDVGPTIRGVGRRGASLAGAGDADDA